MEVQDSLVSASSTCGFVELVSIFSNEASLVGVSFTLFLVGSLLYPDSFLSLGHESRYAFIELIVGFLYNPLFIRGVWNGLFGVVFEAIRVDYLKQTQN